MYLFIYYIDGKMNGIYRGYNESGELYEEVNYVDGEIVKK
jgi:antitoxin component YwqK of YwqJK toxin-antitoxin module